MDEGVGGKKRKSKRKKSTRKGQVRKTARRAYTKKRKSAKRKSKRKSGKRASSGHSGKKTYVICDDTGKDSKEHVNHTARNSGPGGAARKLAKHILGNSNSGRICIRQKTPGRGHNKVFCYKATREMVPAPEFMVKQGRYKKGQKIPTIKVKSAK